MAKSSQAFRTIREVADWLDVKAHVLRFWESKFPQIKPVKRAGGRRYYRPGDMELVGGIKVLLHEQGLTIKGVQDLIRDAGTGHVCALSPPIDTLDFDDAPSDEIAAWDRELAADSVEEAVVIEAPIAEPPTDLPALEPAEDTGPVEPVAPAFAEPAAEGTALPLDPALDGTEARFDLATELAEIEATLADSMPEDPPVPPQDAPVEPEFAFDMPEGSEREEEPLLVEADAPFDAMPEPQPTEPAPEAALPDADPEIGQDLPAPEAAPAEPAELAEDTAPLLDTPLAEDTAPIAAPTETAPVVVPANTAPVAAPADTADLSEQPMIALMADFAELTARIPALSDTERAALAPLLARSADLAARLSA